MRWGALTRLQFQHTNPPPPPSYRRAGAMLQAGVAGAAAASSVSEPFVQAAPSGLPWSVDAREQGGDPLLTTNPTVSTLPGGFTDAALRPYPEHYAPLSSGIGGGAGSNGRGWLDSSRLGPGAGAGPAEPSSLPLAWSYSPVGGSPATRGMAPPTWHPGSSVWQSTGRGGEDSWRRAVRGQVAGGGGARSRSPPALPALSVLAPRPDAAAGGDGWGTAGPTPGATIRRETHRVRTPPSVAAVALRPFTPLRAPPVAAARGSLLLSPVVVPRGHPLLVRTVRAGACRGMPVYLPMCK